MSKVLSEVQAAADALTDEEKRHLISHLTSSLGAPTHFPNGQPIVRGCGPHSILDIPKVSLGGMLRPLTSDDDLLGEMLEGRYDSRV